VDASHIPEATGQRVLHIELKLWLRILYTELKLWDRGWFTLYRDGVDTGEFRGGL